MSSSPGSHSFCLLDDSLTPDDFIPNVDIDHDFISWATSEIISGPHDAQNDDRTSETNIDFVSWAHQQLDPAQPAPASHDVQNDAENTDAGMDFVSWACQQMSRPATPQSQHSESEAAEEAGFNIWLDSWLIEEPGRPQENDFVASAPRKPAWIPERGTGAFKRRADGELVGGAVNQPDVTFEVISSTQHAPERAWGGRLISQSTDYVVSHNLQDITDIFFAAEAIDSLVDQIVRNQITDANDQDYVALKISHPELSTPLRISFHQKKTFKPQAFLDSIYRWVQSGTVAFLMTGRLTLEVSVLSASSGSAPKSKRESVPRSVDAFFNAKTGITKIQNNGSDCGFLAMTLSKLCADDDSFSRTKDRNRWYMFTKPNSPELKEASVRLFSQLGISTDTPFNATMYQRVQESLSGYQLIIVERPSAVGVLKLRRGLTPLFRGPSCSEADYCGVSESGGTL